ncbi:unnamed protein product [Hermetia illucens]|uniref:Uncharacterized protein n=2 Tax=Hermetia illucens TaxID=343691 RepID=A0A7R8YSJ5_HERIL|nr:unnamed protein product [Hermetia illucens]
MADIKFPPKCEPISRNFDEAFLEDHLTSIFYYFTSFSHDTDYIVEYYNLWAELNEIGKMENSVVVPVLATCTATEILRNWIETFGHVERKYADNFFDLYRNVTKHLKRIDQNSRNYMWKYNLLQVWAEKALFRLDVINRRMNETVVDQLFAKMVQILLELGSRWDNPDKMMEFIRKGLEQMVQSSAKLGRSALKELLMPLLTGNSSMRLSIKGCISHLTVRQCQFLCSLISRKILLNHRCELFDGLELRMAEKLLLIINNFEVFEPLILVATK